MKTNQNQYEVVPGARRIHCVAQIDCSTNAFRIRGRATDTFIEYIYRNLFTPIE